MGGKEIVKFWRFFDPFFILQSSFFWYQTLSKVPSNCCTVLEIKAKCEFFQTLYTYSTISKIWVIFWFPFIPKNISFFLELPKQNSLTSVMYGTGIEPVCPREFLAVHHCSSSFEIIVNISPFLKGKSSGSLQKKMHFNIFYARKQAKNFLCRFHIFTHNQIYIVCTKVFYKLPGK